MSVMDVQPHKKCTGCGIDKPLNEYGMRSASADGKTSQCKKCVAAKSRIATARRRAGLGIKTDRKSQRHDTPFGDARLLSRPMGQWAEE